MGFTSFGNKLGVFGSGGMLPKSDVILNTTIWLKAQFVKSI